MGNKFGTAINCMDGRTQIAVIEYLKSVYDVDYVDLVTEPGPNKILAENKDVAIVDSIKRRVKISAWHHDSKLVAVVGHHDCAGNPADKDAQIAHILSAVEAVKHWGLNVQVVGLWVDKNWKVRLVQ